MSRLRIDSPIKFFGRNGQRLCSGYEGILRQMEVGQCESKCNMIEKNPGKLTWNANMEVCKMIVLFNWVILRFHVNFQGCNLLLQSSNKPNITMILMDRTVFNIAIHVPQHDKAAWTSGIQCLTCTAILATRTRKLQ